MSESTDFKMLRLFDALRPKDYHVTIVAPNGACKDMKFATQGEAKIWADTNRGPSDVVMTRHVENGHLKN